MNRPNEITRRSEKLALLVGSNPLPNYLAAVILNPREVVLLYSPETREPCDHLRAALVQWDRTINVKVVCIHDATDARKIHDACRDLEVDHLHYSGGTKPMAAHALKACRLDDSQASYLDERRALLRFDDGYEVRLDRQNLGLTLDLLLRLHGIERRPSTGSGTGTPTEADVDAIAGYVLKQPDFAGELYGALRPDNKRRNITQAKQDPWRPPSDLPLSVSVVPGNDWTNAQYERWDEFLRGGWLERWTAKQIRDCIGGKGELEVAIQCKRMQPSPAEFQIDVALVRGHRLYVVSCTTDNKKPLCKSKLFEVSLRARQMGGDLARSALVCLLDGNDQNGPYVEQLRADIASVWDAPNVPRVFGLADLREWAGIGGTGNLNTLKEWLAS